MIVDCNVSIRPAVFLLKLTLIRILIKASESIDGVVAAISDRGICKASRSLTTGFGDGRLVTIARRPRFSRWTGRHEVGVVGWGLREDGMSGTTAVAETGPSVRLNLNVLCLIHCSVGMLKREERRMLQATSSAHCKKGRAVKKALSYGDEHIG